MPAARKTPSLFPNPVPPRDPTKPETHCAICGQRFIFDAHGIARHKPGDGRRCDQLIKGKMGPTDGLASPQSQAIDQSTKGNQ